MAKSYLSLEDAAQMLGIAKDELVRLREKGEVRGFADRGTWKFRQEDVAELQRKRSADSHPDVPLMVPDDDDDDFGSAIMVEDELGEQPTQIRKSSDPLLDSGSEIMPMSLDSDSDVRLVGDASDVNLAGGLDLDPLGMESGSGVNLEGTLGSPSADSFDDPFTIEADSDVKMIGDSGINIDFDSGDTPGDSVIKYSSGEHESPLGAPSTLDSDSDVRLTSPVDEDSDSDVALISDSSATINIGPLDDQLLGSDSDVRLVADVQESSDSDVKLFQTMVDQSSSDSDVALLSDDDASIALDFSPSEGEGASVLSDESGIALSGDDSAMLLQGESGISLEGPSDSGISLEADDDEGITIDLSGDSGISLDSASDSGISLESISDSGISLEDSGELFGGTVPMMKAFDDDDVAETAFEIPALSSDDDSEFELGVMGDDSDDETGVFDMGDASDTLDDAVFDLDEVEDEPVDMFGDDDDTFGDDELEVDEDILDEDDMELDAFAADDDVFDEGMAPTRGGGGYAPQMAMVPVEQEWGAGTFVSLLLCSGLLVVVGLAMFDLVNNIWSWGGDPSPGGGAILDALGSLYK
ncbi:MAG: helix-turn-helix domain-containing protein [Planctomycetaceae bacterium]